MNERFRPGPRPTKIKTFTSESNALRALKNAGILGVPHEIQIQTLEGRRIYKPIFYPDLAEDVRELQSRGFAAKLSKPGSRMPE